MMQQLSEGLLVLNEQGIVTSANQAATTMLGYEPGKLIGRSWQEFWPKNMPPYHELGTGEVRLDNILIPKGDGESVPVAVSVNSISPTPPTAKLMAMTRLANTRQFDEAFVYTQRLAGIGTLSASIAHELNNPLSIITTLCTNLMDDLELNSLSAEQLQRSLAQIEQSAWRCAHIIEVLRNYTFADSPAKAVTDLNLIVKDALTLVRHHFQGEGNVKIETELSLEQRSLVCDHNRMTQVLINLLLNARDAMQPVGGLIRIKSWIIPGTADAEDGQRKRPSVPHYFAFSVQDSGCGIPAEAMDKIFQPFFTTKNSISGTGLGLTIAKRIVAQHGGRIWAENNPEGGATFTVILPQRHSGVPSLSKE